MANENLDDNLAMRISKEDLDQFKVKTAGLGKAYQVMIREMIRAFNEDRIKIIPTEEQKAGLKVYQS